MRKKPLLILGLSGFTLLSACGETTSTPTLPTQPYTLTGNASEGVKLSVTIAGQTIDAGKYTPRTDTTWGKVNDFTLLLPSLATETGQKLSTVFSRCEAKNLTADPMIAKPLFYLKDAYGQLYMQGVSGRASSDPTMSIHRATAYIFSYQNVSTLTGEFNCPATLSQPAEHWTLTIPVKTGWNKVMFIRTLRDGQNTWSNFIMSQPVDTHWYGPINQPVPFSF